MKKIELGNIKLFNANCIEFTKQIEDNSVDLILTDPPYSYLDHKLEDNFTEENEDELFSEFKRILKKNGFVVMFGRGTSFYRRNYKLEKLGFKFKEEIIWNKYHSTSPTLPISRVHETIAVFGYKSSKIRRVKFEYTEIKKYYNERDMYSAINDIKRIKSALNNKVELENIKNFIEKGIEEYVDRVNKHAITSKVEKRKNLINATLTSILNGMLMKSIVDVNREHYDFIHPTQKPVRLLEMLILITSDEGNLVYDPFAGSASTAIAAYNTGRKFIGTEIDHEFFENASKRIVQLNPKLF